MEHILLRQLASDYRQIAFQFRLKLRAPNIVLSENKSLWGRWNPLSRTIELQKQLVLEHSWDTVLYVLKHEMAHQVVSEVFGLPDADHGESFHKACDLLDLPEVFRRGSGTLADTADWKIQSTKTEAIVSVIEKIQKLFALASSTNSEAEAATAIARARELTRKYDIRESAIAEKKEDLRYVIWNTEKQRLSPLYSHLAALLMEHYAVDVIFTTSFSVRKLKPVQCLEIYGRETQVLIAEYVLHFLLTTLENLWATHARNKKATPLLKKSYQLGVIAGFEQRLKSEASRFGESPTTTASTTSALQVVEQQERLQFLQKRYPRIRSRSAHGSRIDTEIYAHGFKDGRSLQLRKGVGKKFTTVFSLKGSVL